MALRAHSKRTRPIVTVLFKILAVAFVLLVAGKLFFRPQLRAFGKWFDGAINAMLIAIAVGCSIQLVVYLANR